MKKKMLIILSITLIVVIVAVTPIYYYNQIYARKLIAAIESKDIEEVKRLVQKSGNINSKPYITSLPSIMFERWNQPPIFAACRSGDLEMVQILVKNGANINVFNGKGRYPYYPLQVALLHFRSSERQQVAEYLLENGVDLKQIESRDKSFWSVIFYGGDTTATDEYQIFLDFLAQGVYPKESDNVYVAIGNNVIYYESNFLHLTAKYNNVLIMQYLIKEFGYNINAMDSNGQTALIIAVINNSKDMLEYLLSKDADKTIKDDSGKTALDYAIESGNADFISLLS